VTRTGNVANFPAAQLGVHEFSCIVATATAVDAVQLVHRAFVTYWFASAHAITIEVGRTIAAGLCDVNVRHP
jgi:hypothetical protein